MEPVGSTVLNVTNFPLFFQSVREGLEDRGHELEEWETHRRFGACMAIQNVCPVTPCADCDPRCIQATADWRAEEAARKGPKPDGF